MRLWMNTHLNSNIGTLEVNCNTGIYNIGTPTNLVYFSNRIFSYRLMRQKARVYGMFIETTE